MFWFVVLLLLAGAGFYFYKKMMAIEQEIRSDQDVNEVTASSESASEQEPPEAVADTEEVAESPIIVSAVDKMTSKVVPVADASFNLEDEVLAAVKNLPGVKQTELYESFADVNKKQLQQLLKDLDEGGKLKREKKGSSYLLYPV